MLKAVDIFQTTEAKLNYLKAVIRIVKSDNIVSIDENVFIDDLIQLLKLDSQASLTAAGYWISDDLTVTFESTREKMYCLTQLAQLSWTDDDRTKDESKEIHKTARELWISKDKLAIIEDWAKEGAAWRAKGEQLVDLE